MKKLLFILLIFSFLFFSCYKDKVTELQQENELLRHELEAFKLTDEFYYQSGADAFINNNYSEAIDWMNRLKIKFPSSNLLSYADKIIEDSKELQAKSIDDYWWYTPNPDGVLNEDLESIPIKIPVWLLDRINKDTVEQ